MSISKANLRRYRDLHHAKGRRDSGRFLVEGATLIAEALKEGWPLAEALLTHEFAADNAGGDLREKLDLAEVPYNFCSPEELSRATDAVTPQGVVAVADMKVGSDNIDEHSSEVILLCEAVSDPGNLGTLLRTADWFGIGRVFLGAGSADPFSPKGVRATAGSIFRVTTSTVDDLCEIIKRQKNSGRSIFAAVRGGKLTPEALPHSGLRGLVVGHETRGVSESVADLCTDTVGIPGSGRAESLNLAVAAGILLYELTVPMPSSRGSHKHA